MSELIYIRSGVFKNIPFEITNNAPVDKVQINPTMMDIIFNTVTENEPIDVIKVKG